MQKSVTVVVFLALALFAASASAVTYLVPPDAELIAAAPAIVVARAVTSYPQLAPNGVAVTVTQLAVDEVLKGDVAAGTTIAVTDPGGIVGNFATVIPGAPRYESGAQYLIFLGREQNGDWGTFAMGLGKFRFVEDLTGRSLVLRGEEGAITGYSKTDWTPNVEKLRDANGFLAFIRTVVSGGSAAARTDYLVARNDVVLAGFSHRIVPNFRAGVTAARTDYLDDGHLRWKTPTTTIYYCCASKSYQGSGSTLNAVSAFTTALGRWNGAGAGVNYMNGGNNESATGGLTGYGRSFHDGKNAVLFGDPFGDLPNPGGGSFLLGVGGGNGWSYTLAADGLTYFGPDVPGGSPAGEVDVIMNDAVDPVGQTRFAAAVTHELGHTLGFRHSDKDPTDSSACAAPLPCTSTAIMNSFINADYTGLQQWDRDAVNTVYGSGVVCTAPSVTSQPSPQTINAGQSASLTVGASGSATLTYQWYVGQAGDTSTPASGTGNTSATFQPSPASTTTYWVRVTNSCGTADSNAVTVTVNSNTCTAATIGTQPSGTTITQGQQTSLSVVANGTAPFTYAWYIGNPPNTSTLVGTASTLTISPSSTTTYWVRVTNSCGSADSNAATVTVNPPACVTPSVTIDPTDQTITTGTSASLFVGYSGTAGTVTWYQGAKPDTTHPIGAGQSIQTPPLTAQTQFWAQITNNCGTAQSRTVTINVTAACVAPSITLVDAAPRSIVAGQTVTLTVQASGSSLQYQWYRGTPGDFSTPVPGGTTATAVDTPPATTTYFVRVSNTCGNQVSSGIAVTVTAACTPPAIATADAQPRSVQPGQTVTLTVSATGTGLTYQWYRGAAGDTSNPVPNGTGTTATDTPSATTSYWVRVTGGCGTPQDSTPIAVTVGGGCTGPQIATVSPDATVSSNTSATLAVSAVGDALHYQWYRGAVEDVTTPVGTDSATLVTPALFADAQFWVKVTNTCGTAKSRAVHVTVVPGKHRAARH